MQMHIDLIKLSMKNLNLYYGAAWLAMHLKIWTLLYVRNSFPFGFKAKVFFLWITYYNVSVLLYSNLIIVQMMK